MDEIKIEDTKPKKKHPIERANFFSRAFFCWLLPYFSKGFKRELDEDDMYGPLKSHEAMRLGDKLESVWNYELRNKKNPSLWRAILKVFRGEIILFGILLFFLELIVRLSHPILISKLLKYYDPDQTDMTRNEAYVYSALIVFAGFMDVIYVNNFQLRVVHLGIKLRTAACSLIYRKALKLSKTSLVQTTVGQMVNLLSNDVSRFDYALQHIHILWIAPLEIIVVMTIVYFYVGPCGLVGAFFLLLFIPFQLYMGKLSSKFRFKTAIRTDERVRLMNEIISGIQVIKMYTWEKPFAKLVQQTRAREIKQIRATSIIRSIMMSCNLILNRVAVFLCIITYVLTGNTLSAFYAFTVTSFYRMLGNVVTMIFPQAVTLFAETNVSVKRIKQFLLYDEVKDSNLAVKCTEQKNSIIHGMQQSTTVGIHLKNISVKWIHSIPDNILENITFEAHSKELVAVVGTVGGGKTTLLHAILKELPVEEGTIKIQGKISYASQESWLFGGSVRQNIVFGQEFDKEKYDEVIRVCALERDLSLFPHGDRTLVSDRGVTLSGGQRARINLARAVYKDADIYLLDDPLSAVDTYVGKQLFDNCICGFLKEKCVVLVTHQLQYLRNVNKIYLMENGRIETSGSYAELKATESKFTKLLADSKEEDDEISERQSKLLENRDTKIENTEIPTQKREERGSGTISLSIYKSYIQAGGSWIKTIVLCSIFIISQIIASSTDYFVSIWSNVEQQRLEQISDTNEIFKDDLNITYNLRPDKEQSHQYFLNGLLTDRNSVIIYSCLVFFTTTLTLSRTLAFFRYCIIASTRLHNKMFDKIVYATMRFFNTNPPGRILNRFSKDIGAVDETLPITIVDTVQIGLMALAVIFVTGSLNPWTFLPTIIILIIFYFMKVVFLATSRDVKRIEAVTRSPIYTHLSASLQGLTTIRAFGAQEILKVDFDNYQDKYTSACFMFLAANRTFGFWLDLHCVIYRTMVLLSILFVENEILGGNVGLALTQMMGLTGILQWGMRQWSEMENQMTSVERLHEYINVTPEMDKDVKEPPQFWPEKGEIRFVKLCLKYSDDDPYVLKDLTFEIKPKAKIGIVGRTGAGKSSLIAALFRLTQIDGNIYIDNVNTKTVALQVLRSKISIIPQEPVLFSGTLRKNLDPFDEYNDEVLWNALDEVELKNVVSDLPAGLDSKMSEGGSNFSVGQRQLLCLARAVIRNNKILVMDEATANVDPHTDGLIQTTIRQKFADCTVLTIAHRLHTIMDSDKILVMDAGRVAEFDHPYTLLQNPRGVFTGLVKQTGKSMAENLISIAERTFKSNNT